LLSLTSDSDTVEDFGEVVRDKTVTGPLREEGEGDDDPHSLEVTSALEKRDVAGRLLGLFFESKSLLDFLVLEFDQWVITVPSTVVLSDDMNSFLISTSVDQPSRGLGDEPDEDELDDRCQSLEDGRNSPCPGARNSEGSVSGPTGNNGTEVPGGVVKRSDTGSVGGESELGDQDRTSERGDGDTETDEESRTDEHPKVLGTGLNCYTNDGNWSSATVQNVLLWCRLTETSDDDGISSTDSVSEERSER
jgi:hypothetical protein